MTAWGPSTSFHMTVSSLTTSPWAICLQSALDLALELLSSPYAPACNCCAFWGTVLLVQGMYSCGSHCLCVSHSVQTVTDQLPHSPTSTTTAPFSKTVALTWAYEPCFGSPTPLFQSCSLSSFSPSFLHPTDVCVDL